MKAWGYLRVLVVVIFAITILFGVTINNKRLAFRSGRKHLVKGQVSLGGSSIFSFLLRRLPGLFFVIVTVVSGFLTIPFLVVATLC